MNVKRMGTALVLALLASSCKERDSSATLKDSAMTQPQATAPTEDLLRGLLAPPGSEARLQAAAVFSRTLAERLSKFKAQANGDSSSWERGVRYFVDYLSTQQSALQADGGVCRKEDRIRVYRGFSGQPILRPAGAPVTGVHLMKGWGKTLGSAFSNFKYSGFLGNDFLAWDTSKAPGDQGWIVGKFGGELIYDHLSMLYGERAGDAGVKARFEQFDWDRSSMKYDWQAAALAHTKGQQHLGGKDFSENSFFISTTVSPDVAKNFGSGGIIVADVCPERVYFTQVTDTLHEEELLVPFFLLPEEIVRIEHHDCTFYSDSLANLRCVEKRGEERPDPLPEACKKYEPGIRYCNEKRKNLDLTAGEPPNQLTKNVKACFHQGLEVPPKAELEPFLLADAKFARTNNRAVAWAYKSHLAKFDGAWARSESTQAFRDFMQSPSLCAIDCDAVKAQRLGVLDSAKSYRRIGLVTQTKVAEYLEGFAAAFRPDCS